jgi:hypothetical protein
MGGIALLALLAGCGGPEIAPVSGRVTFNGQPVGPGTVIFVPDDPSGTSGRSAVGQFAEDGIYRLTTTNDGDGAVVGRHRVIIQPAGTDESTTPAKSQIPLRYADPQVSGLTAEVESGTNTIDFPLTP